MVSPGNQLCQNMGQSRHRYAPDNATGVVSGRSYGNAGSPDLLISHDARSGQAAQPGKGGGSILTGYQSFFGLRLPRRQRPGAWYDPGGPGGAFGGGWADGTLTVRDRHIMARQGYAVTSTAPSTDPALPNRLADGPPQTQYQMVNTTESWQLGTDKTTQEDNPGPHNTVPVAFMGASKHDYGQEWTGRQRFRLGQQDGNRTRVMGPPLGEWREYGVRGVTGMHGPAPDIYNPNVRGKPQLVQAGEPGMQAGDTRLVDGGVPHGLHSPTIQSTFWTGARFATTPQMVAPRVDRPNNSKIAGQSMGQMYPTEAEAGVAGHGTTRPVPRLPDPGRTPGVTSRFLARG